MKQALTAGLPQLSRNLSDAQLNTLCQFGDELLSKNQVMNLTAIIFSTASHCWVRQLSTGSL